MPFVRYIPGPQMEWDWGEAFVLEPEDGARPQYYDHRGIRCHFAVPLADLVRDGKWMRAIDPDMEVDTGL